MDKISEDNIRKDLLDILSQLTGLDGSSFKDQDRLREDLGLDSLQSMELLSRISDRYDIDLEVENVMDVKTVSDVVSQLAEFMCTGKN